MNSAREIARLSTQHAAYRWLRGGVSINHRTLSDFRSGHGAALDELFSQVLGLKQYRADGGCLNFAAVEIAAARGAPISITVDNGAEFQHKAIELCGGSSADEKSRREIYPRIR